MRAPSMALILWTLPAILLAQSARDREIPDAHTRAWWHTTEVLSRDDMEGRDTGSAGHERAAKYVAARLKAANLIPAGDRGTYFQSVPIHEVAVNPQGTHFTVIGSNAEFPLRFLQEITIGANETLPSRFEGRLTFRGYCGRDAMQNVAGQIVVCFGTQRIGLPSREERIANARTGNAIGVIEIDDPYFTIEPRRWPVAYARTLRIRAENSPTGATQKPLAQMRISAPAAERIFGLAGRAAETLMKLGGTKQPLPSFDLPVSLRVALSISQKDLSSNNVLAKLEGTDATLKDECIVLSAHLDGYGFGTAIGGDNLYNGTLDDAAYVALLIQLADDIRAKRVPTPKRSLLFAAFTGEEKGLLGSNWFVTHPTVPMESLAANVNLDQLRPLFPLRILTAEALDDTTLGAIAREVGRKMNIELRPDLEPERGLLQRADQYPFLLKHVPAISFVFAYEPNTDAERRYRKWYETRYHHPRDDLSQPIDFEAARRFNAFFYALVASIGDAPTRPSIHPTSAFAKAQQ